MIRQCAWCGEILESPGGIPETALITHSICSPCEDRFAGSQSLDSVRSDDLSPVLLG